MSSDLRTLRIDQIGSLNRPQCLKEVYGRWQEGQASEQEWIEAQDKAIREVIAKQEAIHYPVISDGEFRRTNFQDAFKATVSGFVASPNVMQGAPGFQRGTFGKAMSKIGLQRNVPLEEWKTAQAMTKTPVKPTVVSPAHSAFRVDLDPGSGYASPEQYLDDVADIQRQVVKGLAEAG
ncbi:MAG: hypothetical protein JOZ39_01260, partial [Chloroflexi bacterium]|nr:hypothetical protein [Chloroflexota bacterium]